MKDELILEFSSMATTQANHLASLRVSVEKPAPRSLCAQPQLLTNHFPLEPVQPHLQEGLSSQSIYLCLMRCDCSSWARSKSRVCNLQPRCVGGGKGQ